MIYRRPRKVRRDLKSAAWQSVRKRVLARDGWTCQGCGRRQGEVARMVVDHKVPPERGGAPYDEDNLQVLCSGCNYSKGQYTDAEWREAVDIGRQPDPPAPWRPVVFRDMRR
jgi:5-methylcytosine-specific restriction endonuclease McrA